MKIWACRGYMDKFGISELLQLLQVGDFLLILVKK